MTGLALPRSLLPIFPANRIISAEQGILEPNQGTRIGKTEILTGCVLRYTQGNISSNGAYAASMLELSLITLRIRHKTTYRFRQQVSLLPRAGDTDRRQFRRRAVS